MKAVFVYNKPFTLVLLLAASFFVCPLYADRQDDEIAKKYFAYVLDLYNKGEYRAAQSALNRADDYSDVLSDLSYLNAVVKKQLQRPAREILFQVQKAIAVNRFNKIDYNNALLLEAEILLRIKEYLSALGVLRQCMPSQEKSKLLMKIYAGLNNREQFRNTASSALEQFKDDAEIPAIILRFFLNHLQNSPNEDETSLVERVLRLVPFMGNDSPELYYLAAPFIYDDRDAVSMIRAYRASREGRRAGESLPISISLGVIDENTALTELFAPQNTGAAINESAETLTVIDEKIITQVFNLLGDDNARNYFYSLIKSYSGYIATDENNDLIYESKARYADGALVSFVYDGDQDGENEIYAEWNGGEPQRIELIKNGITLTYDNFPSVKTAYVNSDGPNAANKSKEYIFARDELYFSPIQFTYMGDTAQGVRYPAIANPLPRLTETTLIAFAKFIYRSSPDFPDYREMIVVTGGKPDYAEVKHDDHVYSRLLFENSLPTVQFLDTDGDSYFETVRHFSTAASGGLELSWEDVPVARITVDYDRDGIFEYQEEYINGKVLRHWDFDKDGIFEYTE
jgi:hypothetical protein